MMQPDDGNGKGGRIVECEVNENRVWKRGIKLLHRLNQVASSPGVYPMTLIVTEDDRWRLVVVPGKVEEIGV